MFLNLLVVDKEDVSEGALACLVRFDAPRFSEQCDLFLWWELGSLDETDWSVVERWTRKNEEEGSGSRLLEMVEGLGVRIRRGDAVSLSIAEINSCGGSRGNIDGNDVLGERKEGYIGIQQRRRRRDGPEESKDGGKSNTR